MNDTNHAAANSTDGGVFVAMPVPHRFVPQVTSLLASLYASESTSVFGAHAAPPGDAAGNEAVTALGKPAAVPGEDGEHPVWTSELYASLINKGAVSSERMVTFMDHLPTGRDVATEIPSLADQITAAGMPLSADEINVALRWFGKFTKKAFPATDGHVWPFEIAGQAYPKGYTGSRRLLFWFEPEQADAWTQARASE